MFCANPANSEISVRNAKLYFKILHKAIFGRIKKHKYKYIISF